MLRDRYRHGPQRRGPFPFSRGAFVPHALAAGVDECLVRIARSKGGAGVVIRDRRVACTDARVSTAGETVARRNRTLLSGL
jgi:hypothetical protein